MRIRVFPVTALVVAVAMVSHLARADVDVRVANGDTLIGTVDPVSEVETIRVFLPQGARLSVTATGDASDGATAEGIGLVVLDSGDTDVSAGRVRATRKKTRVKGVVAVESGDHRIQVTATRPGGYRLTVKWKSPKRVTRTATFVDGTAQVSFAANADAVASFKAAPAKRSGARPSLVALGGVAVLPDVFPRPFPEQDTHAASGVVLPRGGIYDLTLADRGSGGDARVTIKVVSPRPAKRVVRVAASEIDPDGAGSGTLRGAVLGVDGGSFVLDPQIDPALAGSGIQMPIGVLTGPTALVIGAAPPIANGPGGGLTSAGPTVFFGPSGTTFDQPIEITIPLDAEAIAGDATLLRVVERSADGTLRIVDPSTYRVDLTLGVVTFPVVHFTAYRAFFASAGARGDLDGDGTPELIVVSERVGTGVHTFGTGPTFSATSETQADAAISGPDYFGWRTVTADLDGDGRDDLAVASPFVEHEDLYRLGHVWVFRGGPGFGGSLDVTDAAVRLDSGELDESLGESLAVGHVVGDVTADVVTGLDTFGGRAGSVYVFAGGPSFASTDTRGAHTALRGESDIDGFGAQVAVADVTGDGRADVVVSAPGISQVFVYAGPLSAGDVPTSAALATFSGEAPDAQFGDEMVVADVNGDGIGDIVVGARSHDEPFTNAGKLYVFFGGADLADAGGSSAPVQIVGASGATLFPRFLASGDLDGDRAAEIVVGMDRSGAGGRVYVFRGGTITATAVTDADFVIDGEASNDGFGDRVGVVRIDADGHSAIQVSAPGNDRGGSGAGAIYLFRGAVPLVLPALASDADHILIGDGVSRFWGAE